MKRLVGWRYGRRLEGVVRAESVFERGSQVVIGQRETATRYERRCGDREVV